MDGAAGDDEEKVSVRPPGHVSAWWVIRSQHLQMPVRLGLGSLKRAHRVGNDRHHDAGKPEFFEQIVLAVRMVRVSRPLVETAIAGGKQHVVRTGRVIGNQRQQRFSRLAVEALTYLGEQGARPVSGDH